jgi:glycerol-3-phosphate acyltransferase PlsY
MPTIIESTINPWVWGIYNLFQNGLLRTVMHGVAADERTAALLVGLGLLLCFACAYLLGSVNFALVISRLFYHDDIRKHGSGNAGATNMARTYGKKAALFTFLCDGLKGVISVLIACAVFGCPPGERYYIFLVTAAYFSAFFCSLGHVFPCFAHFHGGKGFATTALSILALNPVVGGILCFVFFPLVLLSKYVSLGSVVTVLFYPVMLSTFDSMPKSTHYGVSTLVACLIAALVTWAHRGNLKRISEGTERKLEFHRRRVVTSEPVQEDDGDAPDADGQDKE